MNKNLEGLLKRNGIDPQTFLAFIAAEEVHSYDDYDFFSKYALYGEKHEGEVNISKVIGSFGHVLDGDSFIDNFCNMFSDYGDTYHTRANEMLYYRTEEVNDKLSYSYRQEPLSIYRIGDKYFVDGNGVHRFFLLKMHDYMNKFKGQDQELIVPTNIRELDYTKTCINYLGSLLWDEGFSVYQVYDKSYRLTDTSRVYNKKTKEETIIPNSELLGYLKERIEALRSLDDYYYEDFIENLWRCCRWEKEGILKGFVQTYLPELSFVVDLERFDEVENAIRDRANKEVAYGNN